MTTSQNSESPRLKHDPQTFVGVALPNIVYVGIARREDFDRIAVPMHDHGENDRGHVLTKCVESEGDRPVRVVFQHWLKSLTTEAWLADRAKEKADAERSEGQP